MLNTKEMCDVLKMHENTIYKLLKQGLPSYKIGKSRRYDKDEVIAWIKENYKE